MTNPNEKYPFYTQINSYTNLGEFFFGLQHEANKMRWAQEARENGRKLLESGLTMKPLMSDITHGQGDVLNKYLEECKDMRKKGYEIQCGLWVKPGGLLGQDEDYKMIRHEENDGDPITLFRNTLFHRDERWFYSKRSKQNFIVVSDTHYIRAPKNSDGWWYLNPQIQWIKNADGVWVFENKE